MNPQYVEVEHALKAAYGLQRAGGDWRSEQLAQALDLPATPAQEIARILVSSGWAEERASDHLRLTATGQARAVELIRAHRLWERYLVEREGMSLDAVHAEAHQREHETTPAQLERLDADLGYPAWDPHGHAIPAAGAHVPAPAGQPLLQASVPGCRLRIVRLDDEPEPLLAQLVALGLKPGVEVEVAGLEPELVRLRADGHVIPLTFEAARHVFVVAAPDRLSPLGELAVGSRAQVVELAGSGKLQRRMLAMGFVPGANVTVIREAPLGDPLQYRVKKANVALRRAEANTLLVKELAGKTKR